MATLVAPFITPTILCALELFLVCEVYGASPSEFEDIVTRYMIRQIFYISSSFFFNCIVRK